MRTRRVHLKQRPRGLARPGDFEVVEVELPPLQAGQVLVQNLWMSIDPYMRRSMEAEATDLERWPLGAALDGPSVGRVLESRHPAFRAGDVVESMSGWQEHFVSDGQPFVPYLSPSHSLAVRASAGAEPRDYVGLLGIAALTAYGGMACLARVSAGDTVVVSSAAGTVGSIACQIAKLRGARVVGSAGSPDKVRWLRSVVGIDHAFDYREVVLRDELRAACPGGIDVVLENATPEHLSACLPRMKELGQVLIAGFVGTYSDRGSMRIENFEYVLDRFLTIRSYRIMDFLDRYDEFVRDMLAWRAEGRMTLQETIYEGLEQAPAALCALFTGGRIGKTLVRLA
ncbi:MAG: NADP-dependent oxidoreductase [Pseudomonadota bacterium]